MRPNENALEGKTPVKPKRSTYRGGTASAS